METKIDKFDLVPNHLQGRWHRTSQKYNIHRPELI